ncbi:MAG: ABC transporter permease, partial [Solirubrobacteraceae bacterium]
MTRVALRGLAARPVRTVLSTLAIVVGVAFVCAALTLTDAMRGATGSLSGAAYDGTDAVVTARTSFQPGSGGFGERPTLPASALERVQRAPGVDVAVGDITDSAPIAGRGGEPAGDGPYFGVGLDAGVPGVEDLTPFRLRDGRWAAGPGEVVIDQATAEEEGYGLGSSVRVSTRGQAGSFEVVGIATFADVKSLGTASAAIFDIQAAQTLFGKEGRYDRILVAGSAQAAAAAAGRDAQVRSARADDRFDLETLGTVVDVLRTILLAFAGVAVLVGAFTIVNTLSIAVAQRTRELGLLRMIGASRRQVRRSVLAEALVLGLGASVVGIGAGYLLAGGLEGLFSAMQLDLPVDGMSLSAGTVVVSLLVGVGVTVLA